MAGAGWVSPGRYWRASTPARREELAYQYQDCRDTRLKGTVNLVNSKAEKGISEKEMATVVRNVLMSWERTSAFIVNMFFSCQSP